MTKLLLKIKGNRIFNRTIFAPNIYILDDLVTYRRRKWLTVREVSISYNQVAQVNLITGIIFSQLDIITTSTDNIEIKFIPKKEAKKAKKLLDRKVHIAHRSKHGSNLTEEHKEMQGLEKSFRRLEELFDKGRISKRDFEKRKRQLIGKW